MNIILFQVFILISVAILLYTLYQYYHNPQRRLLKAQKLNKYFYLDEQNNSKKNLQIVYQGCLFEGEKYLGIAEDSFEVVNIHIIVRNPLDLKGITREDLAFLEQEILASYPHAAIEWIHPINQLV